MILDIGPATIVIKVKKNEKELYLNKSYLEDELKKVLSDLRDVLPVLKMKASMIKNTKALPDVAKKMVEATKLVDGSSLTPMASVAGAISDFLCEKIRTEFDPDFISVNNGGDISVYVKDGFGFYVDLGDIRNFKLLKYRFLVSGLEKVGIATSGFGGRSFTLGLCDSVTVFAEDASIADASATHICNATYLETKNVKKRKAKEIDPLSDLDEEVIIERGVLSYEEKRKCLQNGLTFAKKLKFSNVIFDSFLYLDGIYETTIDNESKNIKLEVRDGN